MEICMQCGRLYIDGELFDLPNIVFKKDLVSGANAYPFLIYNTLLCREEVVKIWKDKEAADRRIKRFMYELKKNASFSGNSGIAEVFDAGIQRGYCYCRMQYIKGITLTEFLTKNSPQCIRHEVLERILRTMEVVYEANRFHGDLHSGNVIITDENVPVLIDFGTSVLCKTRQTSRDRDARLLWELGWLVLPEMHLLSFLEKRPKAMESKELCQLLLDSIKIAWSLSTTDMSTADRYTKIERLSCPLKIMTENYPAVDEALVRDFLSEHGAPYI